jgi:hypothetical protein
MKLKQSCWALYGQSNIARIEGNIEKAAMLVLRASLMKPDDASLAKEAMKALLSAAMYNKMIDLTGQLSENVAGLGRIKLYKAFAYMIIIKI